MKTQGMTILAVTLAFAATGQLAAAESKEDAVKKELARLQGTWQLIAAETDGKKSPEDQVAKIRVVIKGSKHAVYFGDENVVKEITFEIDSTKMPKTADDTLPDGKKIHSIYELDGDTLKSCVAPPDKERPMEFSAKAGSGNTLRVFKRQKP